LPSVQPLLFADKRSIFPEWFRPTSSSHGLNQGRINQVLGDEPDLQFVPANAVESSAPIVNEDVSYHSARALADRARGHGPSVVKDACLAPSVVCGFDHGPCTFIEPLAGFGATGERAGLDYVHERRHRRQTIHRGYASEEWIVIPLVRVDSPLRRAALAIASVRPGLEVI